MYVKWKYMFLASVWSFSHLRSVFLDRVIHFGETLGDEVKRRRPEERRLGKEGRNVGYMKEQALSFNIILIASQ